LLLKWITSTIALNYEAISVRRDDDEMKSNAVPLKQRFVKPSRLFRQSTMIPGEAKEKMKANAFSTTLD
jgi:hypothetical protein